MLRARGERDADHGAVFGEIYRNNAWNAGSGLGSLEESTRPYRAFLQRFLKTHGVKSVVDLGCGDWQFARHIDWSDIDYVGVDVSDLALERARAAAPAGARFMLADATRDDLPRADLLIAKDVLQHWPRADIEGFARRLQAYKWALITNTFDAAHSRQNAEIALGDFRPLDLTAPPFSWSGDYVFAYGHTDAKRSLLVTAREPPR